MKEQDAALERPEWVIGNSIHEVAFCTEFLEEHPMKSVGGKFYTTNGQIHDESALRKEVFDLIKPYVTSSLSKKVSNLIEVMRMECSMEEFPLQLDRIHVANGTFYLNGELNPEKQFCENRFPVAVNLCAGAPVRFLTFLRNLLYEEDIPTLQEYLGYCLIPCTKAQKMLIILGKGGEGKSRLGLILKKLIGPGVTMNSIQKIETNKFARADLEGRLVMVDDDMEMTALPKTSVLKTLVTAESDIDLEKKGVQSYQGQLYARFLCFGNGELTSVSDQSFGFYRRQLVLYTKDAPPGRENDPFLVEKMVPELESILMWCLAGLARLIKNNYQFTVSPRAQQNTRSIQMNLDTVVAFMGTTDYFELDPNSATSSKELYDAYVQFCNDNLFEPKRNRAFVTKLHNRESEYHLEYGNNVYTSTGVRVWGFKGIKLKYKTLF